MSAISLMPSLLINKFIRVTTSNRLITITIIMLTQAVIEEHHSRVEVEEVLVEEEASMTQIHKLQDLLKVNQILR
jgi:hypothetical protein